LKAISITLLCRQYERCFLRSKELNKFSKIQNEIEQ